MWSSASLKVEEENVENLEIVQKHWNWWKVSGKITHIFGNNTNKHFLPYYILNGLTVAIFQKKEVYLNFKSKFF